MSKKWIQDERGFTLLEMLVVLTIVMVLCSVVVFYSHEKLMKSINYQLMNQIELTFRMTQMKAIDEQKEHRFEVINRKTIQVRVLGERDYMVIQPLPENMELHLAAPSSFVTFKPSGNLNAFGGMTYHYGRERYGYSINIGKGRIVKGVVSIE